MIFMDSDSKLGMNLGESKFMNGTQDCPATAKKASNGAIATLNDKNPYYPTKNSASLKVLFT